MTHVRRWLFLGLVLLGTQLSAGCYLGYTNRPVLFPGIACGPKICGAPACAAPTCGTCCYHPFGGGPSLLGGPAVAGPVYDAGYPAAAPTPGCVGCSSQYPTGGIPIAGSVGGAPIAGTPGAMVPSGWVPFDSGTVTTPTVKPPAGSVPLQMPSEMKESKKIFSAGK